MLALRFDPNSRETKVSQIIQQVRSLIEEGTLRVGEKLPSSRRLAEQLGVHRATVATAYQELWSLGHVAMRPGSCPRVRQRARSVPPPVGPGCGRIDWQRASAPSARRLIDAYSTSLREAAAGSREPCIDFRSLDIDRRLFPLDDFRRCLNRVMKAWGRSLLGYGDACGFGPLRETIARRLRGHGISVMAEEILITDGFMHGIDLVLRLLAAPRRSAAVEVPTYSQVLPLLRHHGFQIIGIPMRAEGMDLSLLERCLRRRRPALIYTIPNFQNPTAICSTQEHRERLLAMATRYGVPILEDGFEEEMKYFGKTALPVKSMDSRRVVIYGGTFSKVLFPGIRVGWIAADRECIERLTAIHRFSGLASSMVLQAAIHEFCRCGYYDLHVQRMHRMFRRRMTVLHEALRQEISPAWAEWSAPSGGYLAWLRVKPGKSPVTQWSAFLAPFHVRAMPGNPFFPDGGGGDRLRLSISTLNETEIREGVRRLAGAFRRLHGGTG